MPYAVDSVASAHYGDDDAHHPFLRAAGRPVAWDVDESPFEPGDAVIGGVSTYEDAASAVGAAGRQVINPAWPSARLDAAQSALGGAGAVGLVGAAVGGAHTTGGWVPPEQDQVPLGYRVGSNKWREAAAATAQRQAALEAVREERRRSARYFARDDERRETEAACEAAHWEEHVWQACRAVDTQRARGASAAYSHEDDPFAHPPQHTPPPATANRAAVGYRPGSAAARRAAGGLYECPYTAAAGVDLGGDAGAPGAAGHSQRLGRAEEDRLARVQMGAERHMAARAKKAAEEEACMAAALKAREEGAMVGVREDPARRYGAHAERVAERKTINLGLNTPLAVRSPPRPPWSLDAEPPCQA
jgi:hypothetical protein